MKQISRSKQSPHKSRHYRKPYANQTLIKLHTTSSKSLHTRTRPSRPNSKLSPFTSTFRPKWTGLEEPFLIRAKRFVVDALGLRPPPPSINVEEFALVSKMFHAIIDVRSEDQRKEGKIPKSLHIPLDTMTDANRTNLSVQFNELTVLCYDQDGSTVELATSYLRHCGAEAWSLEGGANGFKEFVQKTRDGSYVRRVTLEEAKQHVHAQSRAGVKLQRKYSPTAREDIKSFVDDEELDAIEGKKAAQQQQQNQ